jgi:hypothetical protein
MPKDEDGRFLPRHITRFNYWIFFAPKPRHQLASAVQRLGEYREVAWSDRHAHTAVHRHIQQTFHLLLNATPEIWEEKVFPVYHVKLADIPNRQVYALKYYIEEDKEWEQDPEARRVEKQLSSQQRTALRRLSRATWPLRSQRPARIKRTWKTLMKDIAQDQDIFERFCENPPAPDTLRGTDARIYKSYGPQAIKLLGGGGTFIPPELRSKPLHIQLDESDNPILSTLLNSRGRIDIPSVIDGVDWVKCKSNAERRDAKKRTLNWFQHALRNMREYRNRRAEIPWTAECENTCRDIQKKLLNS